MDILGIACHYHDAAAAVIRDGVVVAAAQEERFTRKKHDPRFPTLAIESCLETAGIHAGDITAVAFYEKPLQHFFRILETAISGFPSSRRFFIDSMREWTSSKLFVPAIIRWNLKGYNGPIYFVPHHTSHAASAFYPSPFRSAATLTADGVGEWTTTSWGIGDSTRLALHEELRYPHSLGLLYSIFTEYLGFKPNSAEYKVMGLAAYGTPLFKKTIEQHLIDIKEDGTFTINTDYFPFLLGGQEGTNQAFRDLFGGKPARRGESEELTQFHKDVSASLQAVTEEIMVRLARSVRKRSGLEFLCMAGGVGLNSVSNGRIIRESGFSDFYFQPASNDAGGAIGAALYACHHILGQPRLASRALPNDFLGPEYSNEFIQKVLEANGITYTFMDTPTLLDKTSRLIADGQIVGWFQGRMEHGQRALGNRSILADPRQAAMKDLINLKIKFREPFRPFAPSVLEEKAGDYFEIDRPSPYMMLTVPVRPEKRRDIPAVTHADGSSRIQTVNKEQNPLYHDLITSFEEKTGVPLVVNTSFNRRGEPIVRSPLDAIRCFAGTGMDALVIGNFLVTRDNIPNTFNHQQSLEKD